MNRSKQFAANLFNLVWYLASWTYNSFVSHFSLLDNQNERVQLLYEDNERQLKAVKWSNEILEEKVQVYQADIKLLEEERKTHIGVNIAIMKEVEALKKELSEMKEEKCKQDHLIKEADETKSDEIATLKGEIERLYNVIKSYTDSVEREHDYLK